MSDLIVTKKIRMTQKETDKLKMMCELSGLKEGEVIRTALNSIQIKREKVPKDLIESLGKMIDTGRKIESVFIDIKETGNIDTLSLKVYVSYLNKICGEIREKYLK